MSARRLRKSNGVSWGMIGVVAALNVGVALTAFFKDVFLANFLGTSLEADALSIAYFIPDAVGNNLFAHAIGVVCVPLFARAAGDAEAFRMTVAGALVRTQLVAGALLAFLLAASPWLVPMFGHVSADVETLTTRLLWIMLPTILLFSLQGISSAALQSVGRFRRTTAAPLLFNGTFLAAVAACDALNASRELGALVIATGITLGVAVSVWYVREPLTAAVKARPLKHVPVLKAMLPYLAILLSMQAVYFVERLLASRSGEGIVAGLSYAFRLAQFPIWTLIAAVTVVILPTLAQDVASGRDDRVRATMSRALQYGLLGTVPIAALLYLLRLPVVSALFERGAFDATSVRVTASFLEGYALSIPGQAIALIGLRYFLARGLWKEPVWIAVGSAALTIAADLAGTPRFGPSFMGYAAAIGATAQAAAYVVILIGKYRLLDVRWAIDRTLELAANAPPALSAVWLLTLPPVSERVMEGWGRWLTPAGIGLVYAAIFSSCLVLIYRGRGIRS